MYGQIAQGACVNLKQSQIFNPVQRLFRAVDCSVSIQCCFSKVA
ncbi:hypothetical protein X971_2722 [Agrobacterium tumefaciens LBA4213 (Ach5)]|nr:hypothetical protein X971_2722 [Agrobacterium tumefaciens LBA4213 (Ach5)]